MSNAVQVMTNPFFIALVLAVCVMALALTGLSRLAPRLGLLDKPSSRKVHVRPVPVTGGLALFISLLTVSAVWPSLWPVFVWPVLAGGLLLVGIGVLDDVFELSAQWRFLVQALAIMLVITISGERIGNFGFLLSGQWLLDLGWLAVPVTVFGVIGVINAINMADGIDGLAATLVLVPLLLLWVMVPDPAWRRWLALLSVLLLVFLLFNLAGGRRQVFLGDAGSAFLGFLLAWLVVHFSQGEYRRIYPVTALWLLALPIFDTIFVMIQRVLAGRSPFTPDQCHVHHLLLRRGYSPRKALLVLLVYALILAQSGWLMLHYQVPEHWQFYAFVALSGVYYGLMRRGWRQVGAAGKCSPGVSEQGS